MFPQLGSGSRTPIPRNERKLSDRIAAGTASAAYTAIGPTRLGSRCA